MNWTTAWVELWDTANRRHKSRLAIRPKDDLAWFWNILTWLLKVVTLGKGPNLRTEYYTTIGSTIWVPGDGSSWRNASPHHKYGLLSHELDHIDRFFLGDHNARMTAKRRQWWSPFLAVWLGLRYLVSKGYRRQTEITGYQRTMDVHVAKYSGKVSQRFKDFVFDNFTGPAYAYMATEDQAVIIVREMVALSETRYRKGYLNNFKNLD